MKRLVSVLCLVLVFSLLSPLCFAEGNSDTLVNWNIRITVPDGAQAVLEGSEYYLYAQEPGYIPYVMLRPYRYESAAVFLDDFTDYMQGQYPDLRVSAKASPVILGDKRGLEIDYSYTVSGYEVTDRRIAVKHGSFVYMFASKEIAELDMTVGAMLDDVVAQAAFLSSGTKLPGFEAFADSYLYCLENGMPKYRLDFSGEEADQIVLHCWFRSGDPTFYRSLYTLVPGPVKDGALEIERVYDAYGLEHTDWFKTLRLRLDGETLTMEVERDERTLAGGGEDNVLTGSYVFRPDALYAAPGDGPFTAEELGRLAQYSYFKKTGFFPPEAEVAQKADGRFLIHLFEIVELDGAAHTATSAWYTVDENGTGENDITGEVVRLASE